MAPLVIKNPQVAFITIGASLAMIRSLVLLRRSVGGNNPSAVASVTANNPHLSCLIWRSDDLGPVRPAGPKAYGPSVVPSSSLPVFGSVQECSVYIAAAIPD